LRRIIAERHEHAASLITRALSPATPPAADSASASLAPSGRRSGRDQP
jgi:hypothetical protein